MIKMKIPGLCIHLQMNGSSLQCYTLHYKHQVDKLDEGKHNLYTKKNTFSDEEIENREI